MKMDKYIVVDVILKNNLGRLNRCVVFNSDKRRTMSIQDRDIIRDFLEMKNGDQEWFIQNSFCHTRLVNIHVDCYRIYEIKHDDFDRRY